MVGFYEEKLPRFKELHIGERFIVVTPVDTRFFYIDNRPTNVFMRLGAAPAGRGADDMNAINVTTTVPVRVPANARVIKLMI